jgi:hypothetical protein
MKQTYLVNAIGNEKEIAGQARNDRYFCMKMKNLFLAVCAFLLVSCSSETIKITLENTLDFDRKGEIVEIGGIIPTNIDFEQKSYILKDANGTEVAYQLSADKSLFIFQADVPAKSSVTYTLVKGTPEEVAAKTHARFVPERKDDFSWENDLAAYRMYGPALADEYPSNGTDLWLKCTEEPVMDKFYADELERKISYHVNHGLGLDCYDVKHTLGCGGLAPYTSKLWIGNHYDRYDILENGPLRSVFTLTYDSIQIDDAYYKATITITADAGSMLNKAVVQYKGLDKPFKLAAGIYLHKEKGIEFSDAKHKVIAYAENAVSNAGIPEGRNYVGVYLPEASGEPFEEDNHFLILGDYQLGSEFTYYFGGGWSQWKFPTDEDWFNALIRFSQAKRQPLNYRSNFFKVDSLM